MPVVGAVRAPHGRGAGGSAARACAPRPPADPPGRRVVRLPAAAAPSRAARRVDLAAPRRPEAAARAAPLLAARRSRRRSMRTPLVAEPPASADAYLFTGCVMDAWQRDVHRAALRVMRAAGARPALPGRGGDCCGALHGHAGRIEEARALARRVIASMPGDAPVVVDSAGCGAAMKDYGHLLGTPEAAAFSARVARLLGVARRAGRTATARHRTGRRRPGPVPPPPRAEGAAARADRAADRPTSCARPTTTGCAAARAASTTRCNPSSPATSGTARSTRCGLPPAPSRCSSPARTRAARSTSRAAGLAVAHPAELLADALEDPADA